MIKPNIKEMIEVDIETLNNAIGIRKGSQELFNKITAKYNMIDKEFDKNIKTSGKICFDDGFDYRPELKQILEKLKMYLMLDEIPINYTENVASGAIYNIQTKKFNNKGIIGPNGQQTTIKPTNINTDINVDKKECWLKKIFKRK